MAIVFICFLLFRSSTAYCQAPPAGYLANVKEELRKRWPQNRTINLVFHGHSVPAGYFKTPDVKTLDSYPHLVLQQLKVLYPAAVINVIVSAIGGENSEQGEKRFVQEVLGHRPDVVFIDYALNDRRIGLALARTCTVAMIRAALERNIRVILLTPSPDMKVDLLVADNQLELFAIQLRELAREHQIGLADSYKKFRDIAARGEAVTDYMSQSNHPNRNGHLLIAGEILEYFR